MKIKFRNYIISLIIISLILTSCAPYKKEEILYEYNDLNCLYYTKDEFEKYKYSDYIVDDITNGDYMKATPNIADYKNGLFDVDMPSYFAARLEYYKKNFELEGIMRDHKQEIDNFCAEVRDGYYSQKKSYIYYYDKSTNTSKLLIDKPVTNIMYDDEIPLIFFDTEPEILNDQIKKLDGRKIMLSDIVHSGVDLKYYMNVLLSTGKEKNKFYMNNELFDIATSSEILSSNISR